ncbi:S8 family peptidase [bacterium]|nr:S8 family peptidase [bacterium]
MDGYSNRERQKRIDELWLRFLILALILIILPIENVYGNGETYAPYWVFFSDKGIKNSAELNTALNSAEQNLTKRALQRRLKMNNQHPVDFIDLPIYTEYLDRVCEITQQQPRCKSRWLNAASFNLTSEMLTSIKHLPFVSYLQPVRSFIRHYENFTPIEDLPPVDAPARDDHVFDYGTSYTQNAFINLPELHDLEYLGEDILIGITDTGFDNLDHNCFAELDIVDTWDFLNDDEDVSDGEDLGEGSHGTKTLSIIAGFDPGIFMGACPRASYVLAKTECTEWEREVEEDYWVAAIEWMDELGVEVVSVSLSYMNWYEYEDIDGETGVSTIAANRATDVGMVIVVSMGNNGRNHYPDNKLGVPTDGFDVLAVGATGRDSSYTSFSAKGPTWDGRIKPDFTSFGSSVRWASSNNNDSYGAGAGTSFSAPMIAGLCALMIQINPAMTPQSLRRVLREVSHNNEEPDTLIGWGIPDALAAYNIIRPQNTQLVIPLDMGWNLISKNVFTIQTLQIPDIFSQLVMDGSVNMVKDGSGNFYLPSFEFNNIPFWNDYESYHVRVTQFDTLYFSGLPIDFTQPVSLNEGWQNISYLPSFPMPVEDAMISLEEEESLVLIKDGDGNFYNPEHGYCDMPDMQPTKGYQVFLSRDDELIYPRRHAEQYSKVEYPKPKIFTSVTKAFSNMSMLLIAGQGINDYDEVGCFDANGQLVGSGVFMDGKCGVAIWGNEPSEMPTIKLFLCKNKMITEPKLNLIMGCDRFEPNALAVMDIEIDQLSKDAMNQKFSVSARPDPFNNQFSVDYKTTSGKPVFVSVYDLTGRRIEKRREVCLSGGTGSILFSTTTWSGGSYIVKVESNGLTRQLVVKHLK